MIIPGLKLAAGAIAGTLTFSCVRNSLQTVSVISDGNIEDSLSRGLYIQDRLSNIAQIAPLAGDTSVVCESLLDEMKTLSRKDSLCLFLSCPSISPGDVEGSWNGNLLENNGWVLTSVTSFISNQLFGRGIPWNGKAFKGSTGRGINRFVSGKQEERLHEFDFAHEPSRLLLSEGPDESALTGSSCVALDYSGYHAKLSLWNSMRDEVRLVPLPSSCNIRLLIGLGCMGWSGGIRNCSPFCLWQDTTTTTQSTEKG